MSQILVQALPIIGLQKVSSLPELPSCLLRVGLVDSGKGCHAGGWTWMSDPHVRVRMNAVGKG